MQVNSPAWADENQLKWEMGIFSPKWVNIIQNEFFSIFKSEHFLRVNAKNMSLERPCNLKNGINSKGNCLENIYKRTKIQAWNRRIEHFCIKKITSTETCYIEAKAVILQQFLQMWWRQNGWKCDRIKKGTKCASCTQNFIIVEMKNE